MLVGYDLITQIAHGENSTRRRDKSSIGALCRDSRRPNGLIKQTGTPPSIRLIAKTAGQIGYITHKHEARCGAHDASSGSRGDIREIAGRCGLLNALGTVAGKHLVAEHREPPAVSARVAACLASIRPDTRRNVPQLCRRASDSATRTVQQRTDIRTLTGGIQRRQTGINRRRSGCHAIVRRNHLLAVGNSSRRGRIKVRAESDELRCTHGDRKSTRIRGDGPKRIWSSCR